MLPGDPREESGAPIPPDWARPACTAGSGIAYRRSSSPESERGRARASAQSPIVLGLLARATALAGGVHAISP